MSDTTTSAAEYRKAAAKAMPERELQENVRQLCKSINALYYHTFRSDRSPAGFPDCIIITGDDRLIAAELKREGKSPTDLQWEWLQGFGRVANSYDHYGHPNVYWYVWRPSDWLDGTIERILRGETT